MPQVGRQVVGFLRAVQRGRGLKKIWRVVESGLREGLPSKPPQAASSGNLPGGKRSFPRRVSGDPDPKAWKRGTHLQRTQGIFPRAGEAGGPSLPDEVGNKMDKLLKQGILLLVKGNQLMISPYLHPSCRFPPR